MKHIYSFPQHTETLEVDQWFEYELCHAKKDLLTFADSIAPEQPVHPQSDQELHCPHISEDPFLQDASHIDESLMIRLGHMSQEKDV